MSMANSVNPDEIDNLTLEQLKISYNAWKEESIKIQEKLNEANINMFLIGHRMAYLKYGKSEENLNY